MVIWNKWKLQLATKRTSVIFNYFFLYLLLIMFCNFFVLLFLRTHLCSMKQGFFKTHQFIFIHGKEIYTFYPHKFWSISLILYWGVFADLKISLIFAFSWNGIVISIPCYFFFFPFSGWVGGVGWEGQSWDWWSSEHHRRSWKSIWNNRRLTRLFD